MRFDPAGDLCLGFFAECYTPALMPLREGAAVLEIGCAEADWMSAMLATRPDLQLTGIDWRAAKRPGTVVQADVLTHEFPPARFDAVVSISTIEHIGLSAYGGDPRDPDGDVKTVQRVASWLKPGGWFYFDVPFRDRVFEIHETFRAYNWPALAKRYLSVPGLVADTARIFRGHGPDAPYIACLLRKP